MERDRVDAGPVVRATLRLGVVVAAVSTGPAAVDKGVRRVDDVPLVPAVPVPVPVPVLPSIGMSTTETGVPLRELALIGRPLRDGGLLVPVAGAGPSARLSLDDDDDEDDDFVRPMLIGIVDLNVEFRLNPPPVVEIVDDVVGVADLRRDPANVVPALDRVAAPLVNLDPVSFDCWCGLDGRDTGVLVEPGEF